MSKIQIIEEKENKYKNLPIVPFVIKAKDSNEIYIISLSNSVKDNNQYVTYMSLKTGISYDSYLKVEEFLKYLNKDIYTILNSKILLS